jgi:hypothetical protein
MKTTEELIIEARRLLEDADKNLLVASWTLGLTRGQSAGIDVALSAIRKACVLLAPATIKRESNEEVTL